jgi:AGCS family alanine or glycine:cation symporter
VAHRAQSLIEAGGPGAIFWMWLAAFFGMATKFTPKAAWPSNIGRWMPNGNIAGGPMYYIETASARNGNPWPLPFALFGIMTAMLGIGTFRPGERHHRNHINAGFGVSTYITCAIIDHPRGLPLPSADSSPFPRPLPKSCRPWQ